MNKNNSVNELIDKFIQSVFKDRPILAFDLEDELKEFLYENEDIDTQNLPISQLLSDNQLDEEINHELIQNAEFGSQSIKDGSFDNKFDADFLLYLEKIEDPLVYHLAQKIIRDNRVRIREPSELKEKELSDEYIIDKWIFHKDNDYKKDLKYILEFYDSLNREDYYDLDNFENKKDLI